MTDKRKNKSGGDKLSILTGTREFFVSTHIGVMKSPNAHLFCPQLDNIGKKKKKRDDLGPLRSGTIENPFH